MTIRDQLAAKQPNITSIRFPRGEEGEKALKALQDAQEIVHLQRLMIAKGMQDRIDTAAAAAAVEKAQAAYEPVSIELRFRGLSPLEYDRLSNEFAGEELTDEEKAAGKKEPPLDIRGYTCALLEIVAVDSDLTRADWDTELYESGRWSLGEVAAIRQTARAAYGEMPAAGIPKGSAATRS